MSFQVTLNTPDRTYFDGAAESVTVPGVDGYFGVLSRHAPMIAAVGLGMLEIRAAEGGRWFVVDAGVVEIGGDRLTVFADEVREAANRAEAEEKLQEWQVAKVTAVVGG